jgi:hypothetical protein
MRDFTLARRISFLACLPFAYFAVPDIPAHSGPLVREVKMSTNALSPVISPDGGRDIWMVLDREEYDPRDITGVAVMRGA